MKRIREQEKSSVCLVAMTVPGASGSSVWVQRPRYLGSSAAFPRCTNKELDGSWSSLDTNPCLYAVLRLPGPTKSEILLHNMVQYLGSLQCMFVYRFCKAEKPKQTDESP